MLDKGTNVRYNNPRFAALDYFFYLTFYYFYLFYKLIRSTFVLTLEV